MIALKEIICKRCHVHSKVPVVPLFWGSNKAQTTPGINVLTEIPNLFTWGLPPSRGGFQALENALPENIHTHPKERLTEISRGRGRRVHTGGGWDIF